MTDYAITGKKGVGKSLFAVGVIRDALKAKKRVATNLNVHLHKLLSPHNRQTYYRLPDRPVVADLEALGRGQEGVVEDENGIIVLDETSTFFNSRSFGDKTRQPLLDWLVHSRKYGWDVYYICQGLPQIDKQIRETMIEYHIIVKRTDKWPIPVLTSLGRLVGLNIRFPKMHIGIIKQGVDRDSLLVDRRWYRGTELYPAYDTQQIFLDRDHPKADGLHSKLSSWHLSGRYMGWWAMNKVVLYGGGLMGFVLGVMIGGVGGYTLGKPQIDTHVEIKIDEAVKAIGAFTDGLQPMVMLSDGRVLPSIAHKQTGNIEYFMVNGKWIKYQ